jgi:hypothetical protein
MFRPLSGHLQAAGPHTNKITIDIFILISLSWHIPFALLHTNECSNRSTQHFIREEQRLHVSVTNDQLSSSGLITTIRNGVWFTNVFKLKYNPFCVLVIIPDDRWSFLVETCSIYFSRTQCIDSFQYLFVLKLKFFFKCNVRFARVKCVMWQHCGRNT